jgi:5-hydroxyisourate hydrolase
MSVSTHVLDATTGRPASGVRVSLSWLDPLLGDADGEWVAVADGETGADGRFGFGEPTGSGVYRLTFGTGEYFTARGVAAFYPQVTITFEVKDPDAREHVHVPLLLSPYGYSTYRGS